jgi:penicillin-binding protein 1A
VAGKTGTAYNFSDTYFFGYSSSVTCGVWVGFDRPTRIYRGAFGKDLALPIWTKVMNIASDEFAPVKFDRPNSLKAVEICRRSGLLATPRCGRDPNTEGPVSGTFNEYGTEAQIPKARCDIHGGGVRSYAREYDQDEWPRAAAAIDLSTVRPIAVMTPTVLGLNDVYGAVRPAGYPFEDAIPIARAIPVNAADVQEASHSVAKTSETAHPTDVGPSAEPEVRKAEAVRPLDSPLDAPSIQAPTPEPITF